MDQNMTLTRPRLTTPRAAAVAGILFSVLLIASLVLIRISVPATPHDAGEWLASSSTTVTLGLNLLPFAGIAFLWFIGVVRDRIGAHEDRFFATVFLGSGLLFLAMMFASAAVAGALIFVYNIDPALLSQFGVYTYARAMSYEIMNIYAIKMAGVFMISTSTVFLRTSVIPRWVSILGYGLALVLIFSIGIIDWISIVFPLWVLLISIYILIENLRRKPEAGLVSS
jgi:hypothetical protein